MDNERRNMFFSEKYTAGFCFKRFVTLFAVVSLFAAGSERVTTVLAGPTVSEFDPDFEPFGMTTSSSSSSLESRAFVR